MSSPRKVTFADDVHSLPKGEPSTIHSDASSSRNKRRKVTAAVDAYSSPNGKRNTITSDASSSRNKRTKVSVESSDQDMPTAHSQANAPSSAAWSIRKLPLTHVPSLGAICLQVFAVNLRKLSSNEATWESIKYSLKGLPDPLVSRLFAVLRDVCPTILNHAFIAAYLLRGTSITLNGDLTGVNKFTVLAIGHASPKEHIQELELRRLEGIPDEVIASVVSNLPSLRRLILRECTKVASQTVEAAAKSCPLLAVINLDYTAVTPLSLAPLLRNCDRLEVLKVAGVPNWTDANISKLWTSLGLQDEESDFRLPHMRALKLRQTSLTDRTLNTILTVCPNLRRLDLSFTAVRHPPLLLSNQSLEKLSLTSTKVSSVDLLKIVAGQSHLKSLAIGALGRGEGSAAAITNSSAMTMTDSTLQKLTDCLVECEFLENVNLAGNSKLGAVSRHCLGDFVRRVGRKCEILNLSGISSLRSSDLEGLLPDEDQPPSPLRVLVLNNTNVDDDASLYISCLTKLQVLEVGGTKMTNVGLYPILDACQQLEKLNLTSCRGVKITHRHKFFETYAEDRP